MTRLKFSRVHLPTVKTMTEQTPAIHALLIGIDYYQPNRLYKSLSGAVRDISLVDTFFRKSLKVPESHIHKLLSPNPADADLLSVRAGQAQKPTYENIVSAFQKITHAAQPGEQVYIHYSGHGGQASSIYPFKQEKNDESIVPMDIGDAQTGRYLRDVELTTLLKRMTDKGLVVTVCFDSCHSGGATRGDAQIRSGSEVDTAPRSASSLVAGPNELEQNWLTQTKHKTSYQAASAAGLPQTRDYVLLAACRPNEYAYEDAFGGGKERHGALTYWMIDTLNSAALQGQPLTYKLLHDRINAKVQSKFRQQMPMIVGESDRLVFDTKTWSTPYTVSVITASDEMVTLNAGQAQGLSKGTRFSIYPLNTTDFADKELQVAIVELTQVQGSESTAKVLDLEAGGIVTEGEIASGAPAVMLSPPVEIVRRVRLFDEKIEGDQAHELPASLVDQQTDSLEKIRQALSTSSWVIEAHADESAHYQISIDRAGNYEISAGSAIKNLRPLLSISDPTAPQKVVARLIHLTKYQAVESLDNAVSKLAHTLEIEIVKESGEPFENPQTPVIQTGEAVTLRLKNNGTKSLKVAVLDLEPTWEISQIPIGGLESPFFDLEEGASEEIPLSISIPDDDVYQQVTETFKVFAVQEGLADFRWLTLPPLDTPPQTRGAKLGADFESFIQAEATRGTGEPEEINPLNDLLQIIGADLEQAPSVTRKAIAITNPKQEWGTKQVQIVVKRSPDRFL